MTRLPELSYALSEARSTPLLSQFNAILNLGEIFGPLLPLDSAITFYAPLRSTLADFRGAPAAFERASEGLYLRANRWRIALDNVPRFDDAGLLLESAGTNRCENDNANPDVALTGLTLTGGPGELIRVQEPAELAQLGLQDICTSGYVLQLTDILGGSNSNCLVDGTTGTNSLTCTFSAWIRRLNASGSVVFGDNATISTTITSPVGQWERVIVSGVPDTGTRLMRLRCESGAQAQMILNQLEQAPSVTSPIVTRFTAGQRAADLLTYANLAAFFNQPAGMALFTLRPRVAFSVTSGDRGLLNTRANNIGVAYHDDVAFKTNDGSSLRSVNHGGSVVGDVFYVAVRWNTAPAELQIGFSKNGAGWAWSVVAAYDGNFPEDGALFLAPLNAYGYTFTDVQIWNEDRGTAFIEGSYPP